MPQLLRADVFREVSRGGRSLFCYVDSRNTHVFHDGADYYPVHRVGKKKAGRMLDGRTWDEMPVIGE